MGWEEEEGEAEREEETELFARTLLNKTLQDAGNQAEPKMPPGKDSAKIYFSVQGHGLCL